MRILLNLVGVVLAAAFLLFMAVKLNATPLYIVCFIGIALILLSFWQDEVRGNGDKARRSNGR